MVLIIATVVSVSVTNVASPKQTRLTSTFIFFAVSFAFLIFIITLAPFVSVLIVVKEYSLRLLRLLLVKVLSSNISSFIGRTQGSMLLANNWDQVCKNDFSFHLNFNQQAQAHNWVLPQLLLFKLDYIFFLNVPCNRGD